ncbi:hypothetical protein FRB90_012467 [Tulasnella sp. 427]|nr:hypothetical protein FRB90_012467 [Tulasnella sp. 427]
MILLTSKFRHFNTKFRFIKLGAIKKLLFALQTRMYRDEMVPEVISALAGIARQSFSTDATIKPIADGSIDTGAMSVSGTGSPVGTPAMKERAEQVLEAFINILSSDAHMIKFKSALPAPRVCLLLLGSQPTSTVAAQILNLVGSMIGKDSSFPRKLELVSFWTILKEVLPRAWDSTVHVAAFDVLFGRANRSNTWRKLIKSSEQKRLRKAQQDHREYIRSLHRPIEWQEQLHSERGLWSETQDQRMWRLDETEGPARIRKKLQPARSGFNMTSGADTSGRRDAVSLEVETQSIVQPDAPPWQESYEYDSMTSEDDRLMEDTGDDKNRRVRHELEPGDVVEEVRTVTRVVGVDASPGLLLVGRSHIYMMDGLVQDQDGDIIDARDAPKDVLSVPGTVLALDGRQTAQRW